MSEIERLRPDIVILAQSDKHESTDWETLAARLHALGVRKVILLGPLPHWTAPLPLIVVRKCWGKDFDYIGENLYKHVFAMDESLSVRYGQSKELVYVSLIQGLCSGSRCLARDAGSNELTAVDSAHLSPAGSLIVADKVLRHAFH